MARLQVRVYRPVGQSDRWAMLGGTESTEQIEQWLEEYWHKGLIFHTGFSVLPREILVDLLPHSRDGIVVCAATKALFPALFRARSVKVCHGLDDNGSAALSDIDSWFFKLQSASKATEDCDDLWLVEQKPQNLNYKPGLSSFSDFSDLSRELRHALKSTPDLASELLNAGITDLEKFRAHWSALAANSAYEVAKSLVAYGKSANEARLKHEISDSPIKECSSIVYLVRYLPPWDSEIPRSPVRLYNALLGRGMSTLYDLEGERPNEVLKIPNLGKLTMLSLHEYLRDYEVPYPAQAGSRAVPDANVEQQENFNNKVESAVPSDWKAYELQEAPSLADLLSLAIDQMQAKATTDRKKRSFEFLKRRFAGETLESIAEGQEITRERVRQITDKSLKQLSRHLEKASEEAFRNLKRFLMLAKGLYSKNGCSHVEFSNFIRIFAQTGSTPFPRTVLKRLTTSDPERQLYVASWDCGTAQCSRIHQLALRSECGNAGGGCAPA